MDRLVDWTDDLKTGVADIDDDHEKLIGLINKLFGSCLVPETQADTVKGVLDELIHYTHYHFDREIKIQEEMRYPEVEDHRQRHKELIDKIVAFRIELDQTSAKAMAHAVERALRDWLVDHIIGHDKPLGEFIRNRRKEQGY